MRSEDDNAGRSISASSLLLVSRRFNTRRVDCASIVSKHGLRWLLCRHHNAIHPRHQPVKLSVRTAVESRYEALTGMQWRCLEVRWMSQQVQSRQLTLIVSKNQHAILPTRGAVLRTEYPAYINVNK
jgi:hypothetical protein